MIRTPVPPVVLLGRISGTLEIPILPPGPPGEGGASETMHIPFAALSVQPGREVRNIAVALNAEFAPTATAASSGVRRRGDGVPTIHPTALPWRASCP